MQEGLFNEIHLRTTVAASFLEEIRAKGKTKPKMQTNRESLTASPTTPT